MTLQKLFQLLLICGAFFSLSAEINVIDSELDSSLIDFSDPLSEIPRNSNSDNFSAQIFAPLVEVDPRLQIERYFRNFNIRFRNYMLSIGQETETERRERYLGAAEGLSHQLDITFNIKGMLDNLTQWGELGKQANSLPGFVTRDQRRILREWTRLARRIGQSFIDAKTNNTEPPFIELWHSAFENHFKLAKAAGLHPQTPKQVNMKNILISQFTGNARGDFDLISIQLVASQPLF